MVRERVPVPTAKQLGEATTACQVRETKVAAPLLGTGGLVAVPTVDPADVIARFGLGQDAGDFGAQRHLSI